MFTLVLLFALCAFTCQRNQNEKLMIDSLDKAIISFVDLEIESPIHIDCDSLRSYFGSEVLTLPIDDRPFLDSLATIISNLRPSNKGFTPDVRMVVEMHYSNGGKRVLCMSDIALAFDGKEMEFEPSLLSLLESRTNNTK